MKKHVAFLYVRIYYNSQYKVWFREILSKNPLFKPQNAMTRIKLYHLKKGLRGCLQAQRNLKFVEQLHYVLKN